jgi:hypothetical protein
MTITAIPKEITKEAELLRTALTKRGYIDIRRLEKFLQTVERANAPSASKKKAPAKKAQLFEDAYHRLGKKIVSPKTVEA